MRRPRVMKTRSKTKWMRGFTLVELMIAVAIIAVLAGFMAPSVSTYMRRSRGKAAASKVAGVFRWARSQAMTRGQVILVDVTTRGADGNGALTVFRTWDGTLPGCSGAKPGLECAARSCAEAQAMAIDLDDDPFSDPPPDPGGAGPSSTKGGIKLTNAGVLLKRTSPDMGIFAVNVNGTALGDTPATTTRLCFAPDGRVLQGNGQPLHGACGGDPGRIILQSINRTDFSNALGASDTLAACQDGTWSAERRTMQKNGRDLANFFVIEVPFNGAISVVQ